MLPRRGVVVAPAVALGLWRTGGLLLVLDAGCVKIHGKKGGFRIRPGIKIFERLLEWIACSQGSGKCFRMHGLNKMPPDEASTNSKQRITLVMNSCHPLSGL
ncbi:MAG: hypothetical protein H6562_07650 [Lewinellaceae bacterium]|nr:hypothetical protein [Lewinellaceae bacterium]